MEYHTNTNIKHRLLCIPAVGAFLLLDAFFFAKLPRKTLVGLRMTTTGGHHTTASTVRQFTECLAAYFDVWGELSRELLWEIIYVQHKDSAPLNDWQGSLAQPATSTWCQGLVLLIKRKLSACCSCFKPDE
ncbi:retrotransposon hot spot (RHS) protein [Trypanosoma cruzi]|nr:retrotransposon hot spot (RHS) protein [Trypanosoma cruzi]